MTPVRKEAGCADAVKVTDTMDVFVLAALFFATGFACASLCDWLQGVSIMLFRFSLGGAAAVFLAARLIFALIRQERF